MTWPWQQKRRLSEGSAARERAERALEQTMAETPMYQALGESLKGIRDRNHLTELFFSGRGRGS